MFTKRENGEYVVLVNFVLREHASAEDIILDATSSLGKTSSWPVIQEKGVWKIKYFYEERE